MQTLQRFTAPALNAIAITAALLYLMFALIDLSEPELTASPGFKIPPIHHSVEDAKLQPLIIKPKPLVEIEEPPKVDKPTQIVDLEIDNKTTWVEPQFKRKTGALAQPLDNQLVQVLAYPAVYPRAAITRGIEGYAVVGFSVSKSGAVFDAFIIESEPSTVFDRAALNAIKKFKYKAKMKGGKPVTSDGQRYLFSFKLENEA